MVLLRWCTTSDRSLPSPTKFNDNCLAPVQLHCQYEKKRMKCPLSDVEFSFSLNFESFSSLLFHMLKVLFCTNNHVCQDHRKFTSEFAQHQHWNITPCCWFKDLLTLTYDSTFTAIVRFWNSIIRKLLQQACGTRYTCTTQTASLLTPLKHPRTLTSHLTGR